MSRSPSWRTRGLQAAASYSGIDLEIPVQPLLTDEMIHAFQKMGPPDVSHPTGMGEARNWLSMLDLIKYMVAQDLESALILEDDVDWDVAIKSQMRRLSDAVREFTMVEEEDRTPYGKSWDVLWIGRCAEPTKNNTRRLEYEDPTAPHRDIYIGWSSQYMDGITLGNRVVQRSQLTFCSFGIAFSRRGAQKVLKFAGKGEDKSYDLRMQNGCRNKDLSCLVVNPEIMHHYVPPGEFGHISTVADASGLGSRVEEEEFEHFMGNTPNILESARCRTLFRSKCPGPGQ
jgi:hypothetical protein